MSLPVPGTAGAGMVEFPVPGTSRSSRDVDGAWHRYDIARCRLTRVDLWGDVVIGAWHLERRGGYDRHHDLAAAAAVM